MTLQANCDDARCEGCPDYIPYERLVRLNDRQGDEAWPLDVEWRSCIGGPDLWLNCPVRRRKKMS